MNNQIFTIDGVQYEIDLENTDFVKLVSKARTDQEFKQYLISQSLCNK